MGFGVWGLGFGVWGLDFWVFGVWGTRWRPPVLLWNHGGHGRLGMPSVGTKKGFRVLGLGFRV